MLSADEVKAVFHWKNKNDRARWAPTDVSIQEQGFFNVGYFDVGYHHSSPIAAGRLNSETKYVLACNLDLIMLSGNYYLSAYWFLSDDATAILKDVDVSDIPPSSFNYQSCNPFSNRYGLRSLSIRSRSSEKRIIENFESIYRAVNDTDKKLCKTLGIKREQNQVATMDIHVNSTSPYFEDANRSTAKKDVIVKKEKLRFDGVVIPRYFFNYGEINNDAEKEYMGRFPSLDDCSINSLYIKSQVTDEVDQYGLNDFSINFCNAHDSHHVFLFLKLVDKMYASLDKKFSEHIIKSYENPSKNYKKLYTAYIEISRIESQIKSICAAKDWFVFFECGRFFESFDAQCKGILNTIKEIKHDIESKKTDSNELVQAENLSYQKRMSWFVALLAVIQIVVAIIIFYQGGD